MNPARPRCQNVLCAAVRIVHTDEISQGQVLVCDDTLDLVELRQVRRVHRLVPEDPVDREELRRAEAVSVRLARARNGRRGMCALPLDGLLGVVLLATATRRELVEHGRGRGGGVGAEKELARLIVRPGRAVSGGAVASVLVYF